MPLDTSDGGGADGVTSRMADVLSENVQNIFDAMLAEPTLPNIKTYLVSTKLTPAQLLASLKPELLRNPSNKNLVTLVSILESL